MRIVIADDNDNIRKHLAFFLEEMGHEASGFDNGKDALKALQADDAPLMAVLDWNMPGLDGPDVCRRLRAGSANPAAYLILLTIRSQSSEIAQGLDAGANDYITKPFEFDELRARVNVGVRVIELQRSLAQRAAELQQALDTVKRLSGHIPICMHCHKIRDDKQIWHKLEKYISEHSDARLSHGICPECLRKHYPETADIIEKKSR